MNDLREKIIGTTYANRERAIFNAGLMAAETKNPVYLREISYGSWLRPKSEYTLVRARDLMPHSTNIIGVYYPGRGWVKMKDGKEIEVK
jgi:hypothetical protein